MIIAVTGSSGFIGHRLTKQLKAGGHQIIELDIRNGIDILNFEQLKNIHKFDVCVHLAALTFVPLSYEKPRDFYSLNITGLLNCIELCRLYKAKLVFASSYVYGKPQYLPIDETHPLEGFNPYAETKLIGETICANYYKYFGVKCIILRTFNTYGAGQNESFLLPMIIAQAKSGKISLKDPRPKRDFVYIDDVVDCFAKAVENSSCSFDIFNVGSGKSYPVSELVDLVNEFYNNSLQIEYSMEERKIEVFDTVADISKANSILGWQPKINLRDGLLKMFGIHG